MKMDLVNFVQQEFVTKNEFPDFGSEIPLQCFIRLRR